MRGLVLDGVRHVSYRRDLPDPELEEPSDAIVAVRRAGLCGSDLHPYEGRESTRFGVVPGHEVVGEVVAIGRGVTEFARGDRVLVPFTTSCGRCPACRRGLSSRCPHGALFGYGPADEPHIPGLQGGQAELVRVPLADGTLVAVPKDVGDLEALLLTDNLPTGWYAAERADIVPGDPVAVVGLGSVGLCAVAAARALGAGSILAVDPVEHRRRLAAGLGAAVATPEGAEHAVRSLGEQGVPAVIEAAGGPRAQALACTLVQAGGTVSVISVQTGDRFGFTPVGAYDGNLTVRFGRAPVRSVLERLLPRLGELGVAELAARIVTHPDVPLSAGADAYRRFAARDAGMVKAAFVP